MQWCQDVVSPSLVAVLFSLMVFCMFTTHDLQLGPYVDATTSWTNSLLYHTCAVQLRSSHSAFEHFGLAFDRDRCLLLTLEVRFGIFHLDILGLGRDDQGSRRRFGGREIIDPERLASLESRQYDLNERDQLCSGLLRS